MNRQILFRGKRVDNGEWVYGYLFIEKGIENDDAEYDAEQVFIIPQLSFANPYRGTVDFLKVDAATVGQYTGLTDKNGKRVYDADVVRFDGGRICKVYWFSSPSHCGWDLKALNWCGHPPNASTVWRSLEVIGNIHDNPDILTDKEDEK